MLRFWVIGIVAAGAALTLGLMLLDRSVHGWPLVIWFVVLLSALLAERFRYKADVCAPPGPEWRPTEERIVDAKGCVRVWCHPATGERAYVREPHTGGPHAA